MSSPSHKSDGYPDSVMPYQAAMPHGLPLQATSDGGFDSSDYTRFATLEMPKTSADLMGDFSPIMPNQAAAPLDFGTIPHGLPLQPLDTSDYTPFTFQMPTASADLTGDSTPAMTGQATDFDSSSMPHGLPLPATGGFGFDISDYTHASSLIPGPSSYQFQPSLGATSWNQGIVFDGVGVIPHGLPSTTSATFHPATNSTSDISDQAPESDSGCHLFRLPQELLDMIFKDAYAHNSPHKIITAQTYYERQYLTKGPNIIKPFTNHKVNDFLVSKQFFLNAVRAWISAQKKWKIIRCGLFQQFGTDIDIISPYWLPYLPVMRSVKVLRMHLSHDTFGDNAPLHLTRLGKADFEALHVTKMVKENLGWLKEIRIGPPASSLLRNRGAAQQARVRANHKAYETYLQGLLATAASPVRKAVGETTLTKKPLYLGSRVCVDSSEMLPEDFYEKRGHELGFEVAAKYRKDQEEHATRSFQYGQIGYATVQSGMQSTEIRKVESDLGDVRALPSMKTLTMDHESKTLDMLLTDATWIASEGHKLMVESQEVGKDNSMPSKVAQAEIHISEKGDIASTKIEHATKKRNRQFEKPFGAEFEESEKDMDSKAAKANAKATAPSGPPKPTS